MPRFNGFDFGDELFGDSSNPDIVDSTERVAWTFYDGTNTYELLVNPNSATMPSLAKKLSKKPTAAGGQVKYEGRADPKKISFSGVILEEAQYRSFQTWFLLNKQIQITDDLGQQFWVYLSAWNPTRRRDTTYPWFTDYSAEGFVLDRGAI